MPKGGSLGFLPVQQSNMLYADKSNTCQVKSAK